VYISFLLGKSRPSPPVTTVFTGVQGAFTIICSELLIAEMRRTVTSKPYLTSKIPLADLDQLIGVLEQQATVIADSSIVPPVYIRDRNDDYLVALANAEHADYIVSGDPDLLVLGEIEGLRIVSPAEFVAILDQLDQ
jgi:putative PIN family toxin of toxin-antitoxin system